MEPIDFRSLSVVANAGIFAGAAVVVWLAGTRLATYADLISAQTRLSQAFLGMVLLGVSTSLPEMATTATAASIGNATLVSSNLFGGVAMQIAVLAIVDAIAVRGALTYFTPQPVLLFQGVMLLFLLALALAGAAAGDPLSLGGVGVTPLLIGAGYLITVRLSMGGDYLPRWQATHRPSPRDDEPIHTDEEPATRSVGRLGAYSAASALLILAGGWALAGTGDALAEQTGLGAGFVGVALLAGSTSLPELSTTLGAVRRGNHEMAVSNILGTNCLEVALFLLADAVYRGGPILAAADRPTLFAGCVGMVVTALLLLGLLERRDRTVFRMGVDSLAILIAYITGLVGMYVLR